MVKRMIQREMKAQRRRRRDIKRRNQRR